MNFPDNVKYTPNHEWIRVTGDDAIIGITEFAQSELGDIVFVEINTIGQTIDKDAVFGTIEAVKTVSDLFMPVSGMLVEKNPKIESQPELINKDPYGEGWIVKMKITNLSELSGLLSADDYRKLVEH